MTNSPESDKAKSMEWPQQWAAWHAPARAIAGPLPAGVLRGARCLRGMDDGRAGHDEPAALSVAVAPHGAVRRM
ncbi:hypothetical protein ACFPME_07250 [Rhodanobacter umsongensis]|uniref:Uncharacterized protein n=1 Tax=Rhodanobacter umsongensis TaxID=633153 RepID=A0ABW0JK70_9GAMM